MCGEGDLAIAGRLCGQWPPAGPGVWGRSGVGWGEPRDTTKPP